MKFVNSQGVSWAKMGSSAQAKGCVWMSSLRTAPSSDVNAIQVCLEMRVKRNRYLARLTAATMECAMKGCASVALDTPGPRAPYRTALDKRGSVAHITAQTTVSAIWMLADATATKNGSVQPATYLEVETRMLNVTYAAPGNKV